MLLHYEEVCTSSCVEDIVRVALFDPSLGEHLPEFDSLVDLKVVHCGQNAGLKFGDHGRLGLAGGRRALGRAG